ncbi:MAG: putative Ig domain-containing protein [Steroidobacteraceae bacterium]
MSALAVAALAGCGGGGDGTASSNSVVQSGSASAPTINGAPPTTVTAGQAYSFTPSASGPSGTTLSFSIQNMPSWATFSIATGALTGTPSTSNVGAFKSIVISVSDGSQSAALSPFNITVASAAPPPPTSGSVTLSWVAPTTNTNGTPLTDLTGYVINYGTSASAMTESVTVSTTSTTAYTLSGLASGTWYFEVFASASDGMQSAASNVVSTTIS